MYFHPFNLKKIDDVSMHKNNQTYKNKTWDIFLDRFQLYFVVVYVKSDMFNFITKVSDTLTLDRKWTRKNASR